MGTPNKQHYLGDGLYASVVGDYVKVTTDRCRDEGKHYLYFDDDTLANLCQFYNDNFTHRTPKADPEPEL